MTPWHSLIARLCRAYYSRITILHRERIPPVGPTLFLGTHRNGAVDGFVYHAATPNADFVLSSQLRRSILGRLFFAGIQVVRHADRGDRGGNAEALEVCVEHLAQNRQVFILPEGTSNLGPQCLPMRRGAARIIAAALERQIPLTIVPMALHYERAWAFRSRVELTVGPTLDLDGLPTAAPDRLEAIHRRVTAALKSLAAEFPSDAAQAEAELSAYVATLGTDISYARALKHFENPVPPALREAVDIANRTATELEMWRHQGVPLVPIGARSPYALALLLLAPVIGVAALANAPSLATASWAGARFPDARNVIALWRLLVGVPAIGLWAAIVVGGLLLGDHPAAAVGYVISSIGGLLGWYRFKKLAVATFNGLRHPEAAPALLRLRAAVIAEVRHEP